MSYSFHLTDFDSSESDWEYILADSTINSVFITPHWQKTWWEGMGSDETDLRLIKVICDDKTIGIAPLIKNNQVISFLGSTDLCDLHDFVMLRGYESQFFQAIQDYMGGEKWEHIILESVPDGSPTLDYMEHFADMNGYKFEKIVEDKLVGVSLPDSWDGYLSSLRKKDRHELRRKLRRLEAEPNFFIERFSETNDVLGAMDDFLSLMAESRGEKAAFLDDSKQDFFRYMAGRMSEYGYINLFFLNVDGNRAAATICFDYNNERSLYNSGYSMGYSSLGTGFLLKAICLKLAIDEGKSYYDLLRGTEPYKYHLGAEDRDIFRITISR